MSDRKIFYLSWFFVLLVLVAAVFLFQGNFSEPQSRYIREIATDDHTVALSELAQRLREQGLKVLDAEIEKKQGRLVYELEVLNNRGQVFEHYYDALTGELIQSKEDD